jgi:uncharacterized damage-inducible protein DinB
MGKINEILEVYKLTRTSIYQALEGLSEDNAAWIPREGASSIQQISFHLGAAECFWFSKFGLSVIESPKDRSIASTITHLHAMEEVILKTFTTKNPVELSKNITTDRGELSLFWALKRVTHHMNYHLGTLVYLRSILEPDWDGQAGQEYWANAVDAFSELIDLES